ncbi:MAG: hypothetical protein QOD38_1211 [Acidimicrobiaceae bacterium]
MHDPRFDLRRGQLASQKEAAMRLATHPGSAPESFDAHDRVRVPDGRIGEVIGFYRRQDESVVVLFSSGRSDEFLTSDVRHCS